MGALNVTADGLRDGDVQAVGGYTVQMMRDEFALDVERFQPDVVLLLAGTNNHWDDPAATDFEGNYKTLLGMIEQRSPGSRIIVSTVPPFGCCQDKRP